MQSKYILVSINDDEDVQKILIFFLKYLKYQFLELYIEKKDVSNFGYYSRLLTQEGNTPGPFFPFVTLMVQTDSVEAMFAEQYSTTAGPSYPIIQNPMVTSPVMSSVMVTSPMVEVVVSTGYDTHIWDDDQIGDRINFDNLDFESDKSEDEDYQIDEDSSGDDDEDEDGDEDVQSDINMEEPQSRLHESP